LSVRSRQRFTDIASHGSAAPTFGRATLDLTASHNWPKVGATRVSGTLNVAFRQHQVDVSQRVRSVA
jgi:hypothetical protein